MARIQPTGPRGLFQRIVFWLVRRKLGRIPSSLGLLAHHPVLFGGFLRMEQAASRVSALPGALTSLVCLRVAMLVGCPF